MGKTTRRLFLGTSISVVSVAGISLFACGRQDDTAAFERLDILLADICDPVRIGLACRSRRNVQELMQEAESNVHISSALRIGCSATRREIFKSRVRVDFAARDIVLCDRFVVARTEFIVAGLRLERALYLRSHS